MANDLLKSVLDCLETKVYSTEGQLAVLEGLEAQCLSKIIGIFNNGDQTRKGNVHFKFCEVSRLQFPESERQRSEYPNRQPVR